MALVTLKLPYFPAMTRRVLLQFARGRPAGRTPGTAGAVLSYRT